MWSCAVRIERLYVSRPIDGAKGFMILIGISIEIFMWQRRMCIYICGGEYFLAIIELSWYICACEEV